MAKLGKRRLKLSVKIFIVVAILIILLFILDGILGPIIRMNMKVYSEGFINKQINTIVCDKIDEMGLTYDNLVCADRLQDNRISSLSINSVTVNKLKGQICNELEDSFQNKSKDNIHIPLGNLIGSTIFAGMGPSMSVRMTFLPRMTADIESKFESTGINQTKHMIYMTIKVNALMALPPYNENADIDTKVLIAETIIVGDVPHLYSNQALGVSIPS